MSNTVYVLLPALARFAALGDLQRRLERADRLEPGAGGELAASAYFHWSGSTLPAAALTREHIAHDAGRHPWLCADLAHVKPDMTGARMLACGSMDVGRDEAEAFADALRPLFADDGMVLETTLPGRWHVRLPANLEDVPALDAPGAVLGDNLLDHLPAGVSGKRWRQLLNEVQIVLHQHPGNRARVEQGKPAVNSLWLWGAGRLPERVDSDVRCVYGDDPLLAALATCAGAEQHSLAALRTDRKVETDSLLDLGQSSAPEACRDLLFELIDGRRADALVVHFASGERWRMRRGQRWRVWRRGA